MKLKEAIILGRMTTQVIWAKITKFPRPVTANLQLTKICNLDCAYCFADMESLKQEKVKDPTTQELFETIDELYKHGCRHIILMGGEPLIRKDIFELVTYIKSKWMRCEIVTNGYYIDRNIEALKLCDSVCLSIDGEKEANDLVRGEGCHDMVLEAMAILKANKVKVRIHSILTQHNIKTGLSYIAEKAKDFAFSFNFSMIMLRPGKNLTIPI
jgi:Fe-coproporphyrin III synthase